MLLRLESRIRGPAYREKCLGRLREVFLLQGALKFFCSPYAKCEFSIRKPSHEAMCSSGVHPSAGQQQDQEMQGSWRTQVHDGRADKCSLIECHQMYVHTRASKLQIKIHLAADRDARVKLSRDI